MTTTWPCLCLFQFHYCNNKLQGRYILSRISGSVLHSFVNIGHLYGLLWFKWLVKSVSLNFTFQEKVYKCTVCTRQYTYPQALKDHTEEVHGNGAPSCQICGKVVRRSCMSRHIRSTHEGVVHRCMCGKLFSYRSNLLRHQKKCSK